MDSDDEIDDSWIQNYKNRENEFINNANLYKIPVNKIKIYNLYINKYNIIETISVNSLSLSKYLTKDILTNYINDNKKQNSINYKIFSILKYNITIDKKELYNFINDIEKFNHLHAIKHIDNIEFSDTLNLFEDTNALFILFYEKTKNNFTKKNKVINNTTRRKY